MRIAEDKFYLPIFFVIDTSESMGIEEKQAGKDAAPQTSTTRIAAANRLLPAIINICDNKPALKSRVRLELITFNQTAEPVIKLCGYEEFSQYRNYRFPTEWQTIYSKAFHLLYDELKKRMDALEKDAALNEVRVNTPVVFFLTDGIPYGDNDECINEWWDKLSSDDFEHRPNFISIGVCQSAGSKLAKYQCGNHGNYYVSSDPAQAIDMIERFIDAVQYSISSIAPGAGRNNDPFFRVFDEKMRNVDDPDDLLESM